jgi:hypothetical protein
MENKLLSPAPSDSLAEAARPASPRVLEGDMLAEVRHAIAADCRIVPDQYLEEICVPAAGE